MQDSTDKGRNFGIMCPITLTNFFKQFFMHFFMHFFMQFVLCKNIRNPFYPKECFLCDHNPKMEVCDCPPVGKGVRATGPIPAGSVFTEEASAHITMEAIMTENSMNPTGLPDDEAATICMLRSFDNLKVVHNFLTRKHMLIPRRLTRDTLEAVRKHAKVQGESVTESVIVCSILDTYLHSVSTSLSVSPLCSAGAALFSVVGMINHSCVPNMEHYFYTEGEKVHVALQALRPIGAHEEVTISYLKGASSKTAQQRARAFLTGRFGFSVCLCAICAQERKDDVLTQEHVYVAGLHTFVALKKTVTKEDELKDPDAVKEYYLTVLDCIKERTPILNRIRRSFLVDFAHFILRAQYPAARNIGSGMQVITALVMQLDVVQQEMDMSITHYVTHVLSMALVWLLEEHRENMLQVYQKIIKVVMTTILGNHAIDLNHVVQLDIIATPHLRQALLSAMQTTKEAFQKK